MDNRNSKIVALLATLLLTGLAVLVMLYTHLHYEYPPKDMEIAQLQQDSIMFGGEYVMLGNLPTPTESEDMEQEQPAPSEQKADEADVEGDDIKDAGEPVPKPTPKPVVTAKEESPMKVKAKDEKPKKTGPTTAKNTDKKQDQIKRGKETTTTKKTDRVADAFGKSKSAGSGKQGSPDGNANTGTKTGKPGISGLVGYTLENWKPVPHSKWAGTVVVQVHVNTRGKVISSKIVGGSGEAFSKLEVKKDCQQKALNCQFSVPKNTTSEGIGTITYRFI